MRSPRNTKKIHMKPTQGIVAHPARAGTSARATFALVDGCEDAGERASTTRKGFARRLRGDASESRPARARARYAAAGAGANEYEDTVDAEPPAPPPAPETRKEWKGIVADMD